MSGVLDQRTLMEINHFRDMLRLGPLPERARPTLEKLLVSHLSCPRVAPHLLLRQGALDTAPIGAGSMQSQKADLLATMKRMIMVADPPTPVTEHVTPDLVRSLEEVVGVHV